MKHGLPPAGSPLDLFPAGVNKSLRENTNALYDVPCLRPCVTR